MCPTIAKTSAIAKTSTRSLEKLLARGAVWRPGKIDSSESSKPIVRKGSLAAACFGIPELDNLLPQGGLPAGHLHEWTLVNAQGEAQKNWHPPLTLIASLLGKSIAAQESGERERVKKRSIVVWIGRNCWPTPYLLSAVAQECAWPWDKNCLFLDPPGKEKRLWTFLQTLRSPAVFAVVGDVGRLTGVAARRMQLAAEEGQTLGILIRPPWELGIQSSAYSKWKVSPVPVFHKTLGKKQSRTASSAPDIAQRLTKQWSLELLRIRGAIKQIERAQSFALPGEEGICRWLLEWNSNHGKGSLRLIERSEAAELARTNAGAA